MSYTILAKTILELAGGIENINDATHCMTRLRFSLVNDEKAKIDEIKKIDGVIGAQFKSKELQVIIGPHVTDVYKEFPDSIKEKEETETDSEKKDGNIFSRALSTFAGFFYPLIIALGGAGIVKGILALVVNMGWLSDTADAYTILNLIADGIFYFMPFFLAISVAERIKTNKYMALCLAGMLMAPTLINGSAEAGTSLSFFGLPVPLVSYASSIIPIILGVILLKYVFDFLGKFIPKSLEVIVTSALTLLIVGVLLLVVLAPLGHYAGNLLSSFFLWLYDVAGPVASTLMGVVFPFLIITGMAYSFFPLTFANLGALGYDFIIWPIMIFANVNQGAASLAVGLKTKNKKIRSLATSSGVTAILGITEPAMYSINLRYKRPFYCVIVGNALAGLLCGLLQVKMFAYAGGGIFAVPAFGSIDYAANFRNAIICLVAGAALTFVLTYIITPNKLLNEE